MKAGKIIIFLFIMEVFNLRSNNPDKKKSAVELGKQFEQAEGFIVLGRYNDASNIYKKLYTEDAGNANLCYKLGLCYMKSSNKTDREKAVSFLEKACSNVSKKYNEG